MSLLPLPRQGTHSRPCLRVLNLALSLFAPRFASLLVYKLPVEDVHPLSHAFFCLETGESACCEVSLWKLITFKSCIKPA